MLEKKFLWCPCVGCGLGHCDVGSEPPPQGHRKGALRRDQPTQQLGTEHQPTRPHPPPHRISNRTLLRTEVTTETRQSQRWPPAYPRPHPVPRHRQGRTVSVGHLEQHRDRHHTTGPLDPLGHEFGPSLCERLSAPATLGVTVWVASWPNIRAVRYSPGLPTTGEARPYMVTERSTVRW